MRRVNFEQLTYRNVRVSYTCMTASKNKGSSFFLQIYIMFKKFTEQNIYFIILKLSDMDSFNKVVSFGKSTDGLSCLNQ